MNFILKHRTNMITSSVP